MSGVRYRVDDRDADAELDRLERGPTAEDHHHFDAVLSTLFAITQMAVHVETGSLRRSGKHDSTSHGNIWEGEISYGGLSSGAVHDPVRYAGYERSRGGSHDFLGAAEDLVEPLMLQAVLAWVDDHAPHRHHRSGPL
jgi:hypothetical protein